MMGGGGGRLPSVHFLITLCHFAVSGGLHYIAPSVFGPPAMRGFGTADVPYGRIVWARRRDATIAVALAITAIVVLAKVVSYLRL